MSTDAKEEAYVQLQERIDEVYKAFQKGFEEKIASDTDTGGMPRIQMLEKLVHDMNSDVIRENLKYVGRMIESLDEDAIIESKKENS